MNNLHNLKPKVKTKRIKMVVALKERGEITTTEMVNKMNKLIRIRIIKNKPMMISKLTKNNHQKIIVDLPRKIIMIINLIEITTLMVLLTMMRPK